MNLNQVKKFQELHKELISLIEQFPVEKRDQILFNKWSLKDVLVHIMAWNDLNIHRSEYVRDNKDFGSWVYDKDEFNEKEVDKRKNLSWEDAYQEFVSSGNKLVEVFQTLPEDVWDKKCGPGNRLSPRIYLNSMIDHYENDHIPQIQSVLFK